MITVNPFSLQTALATLLDTLTGYGILSKMDALYVAQATETASKTCLIDITKVATNVGGATFTPNVGFTIDVNKYIDTGRTLAGAKAAVNDCHLWAYYNTNTATSGTNFYIGVNSVGSDKFSLSNAAALAPDEFTGRLCDVPTAGSGYVSNQPTSFIGASRESSTLLHQRVKTTAVADYTTANAYNLPTSTNVLVGSNNGTDGFQLGICSGWGWGSKLTAAELGNLYTAIQAYMTAIGCAV